MLQEEAYNRANKLFRSVTNQQVLMVEAALIWSETLPKPYSFTSYGCGFGMFELNFLDRFAKPVKHFTGVDINRSALRHLRGHLFSRDYIDTFFLKKASTSSAAKEPSTSSAVSVQSMFFHGRDEAKEILRDWSSNHENVFIAVTPYNELNRGFAENLTQAGVVDPAFSQVVEELLTELEISFESSIAPAVITLPRSISDEELREFVSFVEHRECSETSRDRMEEIVFSFGNVEETADAWLIPHPVAIITF